jgi:DNA processing protein
MNQKELGYLLALIRFPKFGPVRLAKLRGFFVSMEAAFTAGRNELTAAGLDAATVEQFLSVRRQLSPEGELFLIDKNKIRVIVRGEADYPALLEEIHDPPAVLFVRGTWPTATQPYLSVVGSRRATGYATRASETIVKPLARAGLAIVSGLAIGADTLAHQAALAGGGKTVAVLGSGIDDNHVFPSSNRWLAQEIRENGGAIISEYPPETEPQKIFFPIRNRIIAGISLGTLVLEAGIKSGALITARAALENGRELFAVPGPFHSPLSEGTNNLIKNGAHPVTSADDVLYALGFGAIESANNKRPEADSSAEAEILRFLSAEPIHIDDLARQSGKNIAEISHLLTLMEMKGSARHLGSLYYVVG